MVKLKKGCRASMHGTLQNAVVAAINDPNYSFSLPKLSDWESVVSSSVDEKQRLEFVGDAVMHLAVALYLYRLFPDAAPGLYTAAADSFEVIVAAHYFERGFADVCEWVQEQYGPLVAAARESYDKRLANANCNILPLSIKRRRGLLDPPNTPLLKKIRLSSGRTSSPRSTLMAQRVIDRMKSKGKVKLCLPTKKARLPLEMRLHSCERRTPEPRRAAPPVIDLTMESESDDEGGVPSEAERFPPSPDRNSTRCRVFHWPPKQGSARSRTLSGQSSSPTVGTSELFSRSGLSLPPSRKMREPSGTSGNPIVIEDSDAEN